MSSSEFQSYVNYLSTVMPTMAFYSSAILTPFGLLGCILSAIIFFANKTLNKTNMGYLYGWLAVFSLFSLLTEYILGGFVTGLPNMISFSSISNVTCKLNIFLIRICPHMASWFQAYITFDRFIQLKYPSKAFMFKKKRTINVFIALMVLFVCAVNMSNLFNSIVEIQISSSSSSIQNRTIQLNDSTTLPSAKTNMTNQTTTIKFCTASSQVSFASDIISAAMRTWLPFVLIASFNVMSIRLLTESGKRANLQISNDARSRREKDFTRVVLKLSFIFFAMNFPLSAVWVILNCYRSFTSPATSALVIACINIASRCSMILAYGYQSLTFYLNFTFNITFRGEVLKFFGKKLDLDELSTKDHTREREAQQLKTMPTKTATITTTKTRGLTAARK